MIDSSNKGEGNCRDFHGHLGNNTENFEDEHGGYVYGVTSKEGEMEFKCSNKQGSREYTLQEEGKSQSRL